VAGIGAVDLPQGGRGRVALTPLPRRLARLGPFDALTTTTPTLATRLRDQLGRPVYLAPNRIDLAWWRRQQLGARQAGQPLTIGWCGSVRPYREFAVLAEAWRRIAARYPDVHFAASVWDDNALLAHAVPPARFRALRHATPAEHARRLASFDIGCCPLLDVGFNQAKSPIKPMEYAVAGAAVVASPLLYGEVIRHGVNGCIADTATDWEAALARLIEDEARRRDMAAALLADVERDHSLERHTGAWADAWRAIVADARASGRVPA
jgi:glycosyltransferase involved in cell wall biosynthesis